MKKMFNLYITIWIVISVIFNVISFIAFNLIWIEKNTSSFWIAYTFISIIFVGHLICFYIGFKSDSTKKLFYNISLIKISYIVLASSFIIGLICMLIPAIPYWVSLITCTIVLLTNILVVAKAKVVIDEIERIDNKVKTNTFFIKNLTVDAQLLMESVTNDIVKKECKKVYDAIRYSDPMSNEALSYIESQITLKFLEFSNVVKTNNINETIKMANEVIQLIYDRKKSSLLK